MCRIMGMDTVGMGHRAATTAAPLAASTVHDRSEQSGQRDRGGRGDTKSRQQNQDGRTFRADQGTHTPIIHGLDVDEQGRCQHWHSPLDIVANRFSCCGEYYACYQCHDALAGHPRIPWSDPDSPAVMCGACRCQMTEAEYDRAMESTEPRCPSCGARFNPGCRLHHDIYFKACPAPEGR